MSSSRFGTIKRELQAAFTPDRKTLDKRVKKDSGESSSLLDMPLIESDEVMDKDKMQAILTALEELKVGQATLKNEILAEIAGTLDRKLEPVYQRIEALEQMVMKEFDPERSVVISKLQVIDGDIQKSVEEMILSLNLEGIEVKRVQKLGEQGGRPPLIEAEMKNSEQKVKLLQKKQSLKNIDGHENVYIRSSHSHADRTHQTNLMTLINNIPGIDKSKFMLAGNGRLMAKDDDGGQWSYQGRRDHGRGRGRGGQGPNAPRGQGGRGAQGGRGGQGGRHN